MKKTYYIVEAINLHTCETWCLRAYAEREDAENCVGQRNANYAEDGEVYFIVELSIEPSMMVQFSARSLNILCREWDLFPAWVAEIIGNHKLAQRLS